MNSRYFDLQGAAMAVSGEAELATRFGEILDQAGQDEPPAPTCFHLHIATGAPEPVPPGTTVLHEGPVLTEGNCVAYADGAAVRHLFPGKASLLLSRDRAELKVAPGEETRVRKNLGMLALEAALRASGQVPIHAAGLTLPAGGMILIIGQSGAGKTTASLALCAAGFGLCSDDLVMVRAAEDGVTAWGLPRQLKVHRRTAQMLPWSEPLLIGEWDAEHEKRLPLDKLATRAKVQPPTPQDVQGIYLLDRSTGPLSSVAPVSGAQLLGIAAADHVRTTNAGVPPEQAERLSALARIVRRVPTYRLTAGSDPKMLGAAILAHLAQQP